MSIVKKYCAEVVSFRNHFENIYSVEFRSIKSKFRYSPGQFLHMALDNYDPSFGWPESRCFSIQTSPSEEYIKITFSVKGRFTQRMAEELHPGKIVNLKLPYGELFQDSHSKEKVVFIAGGTGVTPFLSLFSDPAFKEYNKPKLYLGIREPKLNIYYECLKRAAILNPNLLIEIKYQNEEGLLDINKIISENGSESIYYISGPQVMISSFKTALMSRGIPEFNIKSDDWQ